MLLQLRALVIIFLFFSSINSFGNLIVFGDSLSDGGNFPESKFPRINMAQKNSLANNTAEFYVPISNPVDTSFGHGSNKKYWPSQNSLYLSSQSPIFPEKAERKYRSISWPQFFLSIAKQNKLMRSDIIVPSILLNQRIIQSNFSYNYSWAYATSDLGCTNPLYQKTAHCDMTHIDQAKTAYLKTFSQSDFQKIIVPGVNTQVKFFIHDMQHQEVIVNQRTIYVFYIGGNDLIIAGNALEKKYNPLPLLQLMMGETTYHILDAIAALLKNIPADQRPKVVYVFDQLNPKITPFYYKKSISKFAGLIIGSTNFWLKTLSGIRNVFSKNKIQIVPVSAWYQKASQSDYFKNSVGKACVIDGGNFDNPTHIPKNNCAGFIFWNAVHPTSEMNALIGALFFDQLAVKKKS